MKESIISATFSRRAFVKTAAAGAASIAAPHAASAQSSVRIGFPFELSGKFVSYGASGKRVEIDFSREEKGDGEDEAQVAVRDYGPGIAPEHLPRLTERFYRVDVADSRAQGGTGLGLALAKHILNRHRGRLSIASNPGQGATFTVHLPVPSEKNVLA